MAITQGIIAGAALNCTLFLTSAAAGNNIVDSTCSTFTEN
jgi:hypothetical protein